MTEIVNLEANMKGVGGMNEQPKKEPINNLSPDGMTMVKSMVIGMTAKEFFELGKQSIHARGVTIVDQPTGRKFVYNIEAEEII